MRLAHGTRVKEELRLVAPESVAVAYIGLDWQSFVDPENLGEIIVSPTAGSSPDAIADLVRRLGWERVHFLNELHAKLYLGKTSAAVGSFNLSANGLSGHALFEAGYIVDTTGELEDLKALYASLKTRAGQQYRTRASKEKQLSRLREINEKMRNAGMGMPRSTAARSLAEYEPVTDTDFYCTYHGAEDLEFNPAAMRKQVPEKFASPDTDPHELTAMHVSFLEGDDVHAGHWMLTWETGEHGEVPELFEASWMYINAVIPNGAVDDVTSYTKVAVQWTGARGKGAPPFKIGRPEKAALRKVLASGEYPDFLPDPDGQNWELKRTFRHFKAFVAAWKKAAGC